MQIISCIEEGGSPPNVLTVALCTKENMSSSISAGHSCEFWAREENAAPGQSRATKDLGYCSSVVTKSTQRNTTGSPQTLDFTDTPPAQQGSTLVFITSFHHQRQLHIQLMTATQKQSLCGWCVTLDTQPGFHSFHSLCCKTPGTDPCHTSSGHWLHMKNTRSFVKSASSVPKFHCCLGECPASFCNSCFNSSSPPEELQLQGQIPIIPSQISQYHKLTWDCGINMHLDSTRMPTFFTCKQQSCLRHVKMFKTFYFMNRKSKSLHFKYWAKQTSNKNTVWILRFIYLLQLQATSNYFHVLTCDSCVWVHGLGTSTI